MVNLVDLSDLTDEHLAFALLYTALHGLETSYALNEICIRLGLPEEETELGLTPEAAQKIDDFITQNMTEKDIEVFGPKPIPASVWSAWIGS